VGVGHSLAGLAGTNPAEDMEASVLRVLCFIRYSFLGLADHFSIGDLNIVVVLSVIVKPQNGDVIDQ